MLCFQVLLDTPETELEPIVDRLLDVMLGPEPLSVPSATAAASAVTNGTTSSTDGATLSVASAIVGPAHSRKTSRQQETLSRAELKSVIFSDDNRRTFSETIQAVYTDGCAHYDWEQTWLCGAITVPTLLERHVGIARLKHPANLGPQVLSSQYFGENLLSFFMNLFFCGLHC